VLNAMFHLAMFWDGRAADLVEQAKGPILNPIEMGMPDGDAVVARAKELAYVELFSRAFPAEKEPVTFDNVARAITAFERTLFSRSRFDDYIEGHESALTSDEKHGLELFMTYGCTDCHVGPMLGSNRFMKAGLYHPYKNQDDLGRYDVTQRERDKQVFKVPSLRNVTLTGPYFHDGQVATIAEAVDRMAWMQLDVKLKDDEIKQIVQFLTSLADRPRTTATPPEAKRPGWSAFQSQISLPPQNELAKEGLTLLEHTYELLGPEAANPENRYSGSNLNCVNCHYQQGTKPYGTPWVGVIHRYPRYSGRENGKETIQDRINGCMERSMSGRHMPDDSHPMKAIVAYFEWLGQNVPKKIDGTATPPLKIPDRAADLEAGRQVYLSYCQSCHGADGQGYRSMAAGENGPYVIPPVWGNRSYNDGAGMHRVLTAAGFIRANMPLGTPWDRPALTDEQAIDVSAYINSQPRAERKSLDKDYPDRTKKPVDCPYPPYADGFPQSQHKYGPFLPILEARGEKEAKH
jgi:thiosulfate dehydrogenase